LRRPGEQTRFGVTVGKKIAMAAGRSRGRRILRESVRRVAPWIKDGTWIVVSLREKGLEASARSVYRDLSALLARTEMLTDDWSGTSWYADEI
jgi:ribonuclease P protein component